MYIKTITGQRAVIKSEADKSTNSETKVFVKLDEPVNLKLEFDLYLWSSLKVNCSIKLHEALVFLSLRFLINYRALLLYFF